MSDDLVSTVTGACACGAVRFELDPPSRFCTHCHCENCRRAHGAAFVTWVGFAKDQLRLVSGDAELRRYRTETEATRSFCATCGTTLFYEGPRWPEEVHVARAVIPGPIDREPQAHFYVDHAASWWRIADALPQYGGESGGERKR
jgi:hypothetical protein